MLLRTDQRLTCSRVNAYAAFFVLSHWGVWIYFSYLFFNIGTGTWVSDTGTPFGNDFLAFRSAADLALQGRALEAYDPEILKSYQRILFPNYKGLLPWLYPPAFQLMLLPFGMLGYVTSALLFMLIGVLMFSFAAHQVIPRRAAIIPILAFPGILVSVVHGQNALMMASLLIGALALLPTRPVLAGIFLGILTAKPHYGLLIPLALLAGGHYRCFISASITTLAFFGLAALVLGVDTLLAFPAATAQMQEWMHNGRAPLHMMVTFFAHALRSGFSVETAWLLHLVIAAPVSVLTLMTWRQQWISANLKSALLIAATLLISPYFMKYDFVLVGAALAFLTAHNLQHGWQPGERLLMVILWLSPTISFFVLSAKSIPIMPLLSLMLFVLVYLRCKQQANQRHEDVRGCDRSEYNYS